jgi:hypothetical protein
MTVRNNMFLGCFFILNRDLQLFNTGINLISCLGGSFKILSSNNMKQLSAEIDKVSTKIDAIEELLKKPFRSWPEEEINLYGTEEHQARKQLREQETILLRIKEQTYDKDIQGMKFLS